ncbi:PREDICTED: putative uncharacterized protein DDB_G0282133 isoform X2 [Trachymyrmex cornetzi]|uniref:putative uncharacterized protein DDB_G0282133 isoform X2 n=1 Tax=Trachymyrmex cornetzi TaxID=471704 RepID=UPI00084F2CB5|nr:PREDICTED: putative uncharacterized protein DDB_G0282133 isoform X2 [Trachymyrmex cornetzi]
MSYKTRKRKEVEERKVNDREQDNSFTDEMREEMETMWEIPQIFHFLYLTKESLNIPQLSLYEMERMLLIPRASKQLANIMTCLLSSPITKVKLRKVPPMPYEFWTNILSYKMSSWSKIYRAKHKDATKVLETIGVEPEFWSVFPETSMLDGKDFEDLSFKQRVWLLKTVCDTIMHTRKTVQEDMVNQPWEDQFETVLGMDRNGARYIYFPQFMPNDLRIYRHSLDNKILSTVKPVRQDQEKRSKFIRYKKRKLQIRNNLSDHRLENRNDDKELSNNDSTTGSFISEDTNLSSISTCSNNNNISLDIISRKRRRSLSKTSEESLNARSSGYDTHNSSDTKSVDDESSPMFKGFANTQNDNCSIGIINEMLHDLKTEIDEEKKMSERESSSELVSQENLVELYKNTVIPCDETFDEKDENEKSGDTLSNSSKTDDEKLNEIINAESSKLLEDVYSKNIPASDNVSDISMKLTSKSDDEKLSETKTSDSNVSTNENSLNKKRTFDELFYSSSSISSASLSEEVTRQYLNKTLPVIEAESNNLRERMKLRPRNIKQYNKKHTTEMTGSEINERQEVEDDQMNETDEENLSEPRLQTSMEYDLDNDANNTDISYNLQTSTDPKTDECKQRFDKMLSDLSVSDFYLVVDSVEELRDLIANFSESDLESNNSNNAEIIPLCEVKLVKKLTELLSSVEPVETTLKDAMRKAKAKLQREWFNFKEGVEDQDSPGESGLSSNWWVLGTQGRDPLSTPGDATLQTLSQSAVSPLGTKNTQKQLQVESENENTVKDSKQSHHESREPSNERQNENGNKQSEIKATSGRNEVVEEEKKLEVKQDGENENASDEDANQETQYSRRVLRARGVSSYTEQLYSDDESDEDELEEWADVEAVYAAPGTQANTSASHTNSKERNADNWSDEEDSDQDWILPSSRKRKNKRSSTNRRLKSFEHKVQNITENTSQSNAAFDVSHPNAKIVKDKLKDKLKDNKREPENAAASQILGNTVTSAANNKNKREVPSMDAICKIESVKSVHSELDIKDEGPVYESNPNTTSQQYEQSNYEPTNPQQKYYYVVPQNSGMVPQGTIIQGAVPQAPQTYYMQQPYIIQPPQGKYLPPTQQQQQQFVYQQQSPQMMAQPYVNNTNYVSYVAVATQPQTEYVVAPGPMINQPNLQNPVHCAPRPQNRYMQNNRQLAPRQNSQHFNSTVIRSIGTPVRGQRPPNSKNVPLSRQRQRTSQTSSTENSGQKVTSLIMLSDSDDEIEMIIMEKTPNSSEKTPANRARSLESQRIANQSRQKPTITSDITVPSTKGILSPQIIQRMSQGGISITPVKNNPPPTTNTNTQLVVVVNETGSHYALALPNGSKLILTPEQVAQIRASNGGKLIL